MNSFSFCLLEKVFISPLFLKDPVVGLCIVYLFFCSSLSIFRKIVFNSLMGNVQISFQGLVTGGLLQSFDGAIFPILHDFFSLVQFCELLKMQSPLPVFMDFGKEKVSTVYQGTSQYAVIPGPLVHGTKCKAVQQHYFGVCVCVVSFQHRPLVSTPLTTVQSLASIEGVRCSCNSCRGLQWSLHLS